LLRLRTFEALHYREFRLLWLGQASISMGTWMDQIARGWLIYELTNSTLQLGIVRGIQAIPLLLLSPIAGSAADRLDRKLQVMVAQVVDGLMYATIALLIVTGLIKPWHVYLTAFVKSVVNTFEQPARVAMISDAVPHSHLTNAIGLNSIIFNLSRSTGPALAGLLIAIFGTGGSYAAQALLYLFATIWTAQLSPVPHVSSSPHGKAAQRTSLGQSIVEGWKFSWRNENVRIGLLITVAASLFIIPFTTLLPVFARDLLGVGAGGQGLLLTAMGIGALCSAVLIASVGDRLPRGLLMMGGVGFYGLSVVAFSASPWFKLSIALMMMVGLFHVSSHALVQTVIQTYSPREFRGRTMSIYQQSHVVLMIGSVMIGALAEVWGAQWAMASMASVGALTMIAMYMTMPAARLIR
jgi:MFS family permease